HGRLDTSLRIDPNTASAEMFVRMGFSANIARRIVHYREKGGRFLCIDDVCKIYGIDTGLVYRLKGNWVFPQPIFLDKRSHEPKSKVELNSADTTLLEKLPGIGQLLSRRIVKYRDLLGGYYSVEQLREVYGLSAETYQRIYTRLWVDTSKIQKVSIATVTFKELVRHPYVGFELAKRIDKYRKSGRPLSLDRLLQDSVISPQQAVRLQRYYYFLAP
ncbi:MAG: helix-hairpin-helix domain-containing protein, partial [Bacteroidales bacterium]